jgi:hypothetical protein
MRPPVTRTNQLTLDAGALIAVDRHDRETLVTLEVAREDGWDILVPTGALAQVWRNPSRQARLAAFLKWRQVRSEPLTEDVARRAGILCGRRGSADIVDATVALCAHDHGGHVMTSDPDDLHLLVASLETIVVT